MKYFHQDNIAVGIVATLGSGLVAAGLLWVGLVVAHEEAVAHLRWFAGAFIPMILVVRRYARLKEYPTTTKTAIITFFVSFIAYMFVLL